MTNGTNCTLICSFMFLRISSSGIMSEKNAPAIPMPPMHVPNIPNTPRTRQMMHMTIRSVGKGLSEESAVGCSYGFSDMSNSRFKTVCRSGLIQEADRSSRHQWMNGIPHDVTSFNMLAHRAVQTSPHFLRSIHSVANSATKTIRNPKE